MRYIGSAIDGRVIPYDGVSVPTVAAVLLSAADEKDAKDEMAIWRDLARLRDELSHLSGHDHCGGCSCPQWLQQTKQLVSYAMATIDKGNTALNKPVNGPAFEEEIARRSRGEPARYATSRGVEEMQADVDEWKAGHKTITLPHSRWE